MTLHENIQQKSHDDHVGSIEKNVPEPQLHKYCKHKCLYVFNKLNVVTHFLTLQFGKKQNETKTFKQNSMLGEQLWE